MSGTKIIFEVSDDELDGEYSASALGLGIHRAGGKLGEIRCNIKEAMGCYFDDNMEHPLLIRLPCVRHEALVA
ncbi:MAG: 2-oxoisovalerate dehydrogenase [Chloroflexi bacterium]|nr:2-oxoisovalerate dehydrogenase [Chloroflexota bacterium]